MSIKALKNDSICVLKCTRLITKAHDAFGQGRGGEGENLPSLLMATFNINVIDIFTTY